MGALQQVTESATLYRFGTLGKPAATEAQFCALENPASYLNQPEVFAAKYGIPAENLKSGILFIESGHLRPGANFVTRPAPAFGGNARGTIEIVTNSGSVQVESFNFITK